jgi:hypothetical protein
MVLREWGFHVVQIVFKCKHSILCTYLGELPHFIWKHHFTVIIVFDFTWYHFVLNNIEGLMIPCCFFERKAVGETPTARFFLINNKNPNLHSRGFEPGCLGCTSTPIASWARLTSYDSMLWTLYFNSNGICWAQTLGSFDTSQTYL